VLGVAGEKDATLAQKLGQLQHFIDVLPQAHRHARVKLHSLGQPNAFLATDLERQSDHEPAHPEQAEAAESWMLRGATDTYTVRARPGAVQCPSCFS
jgi:hypothetical protein